MDGALPQTDAELYGSYRDRRDEDALRSLMARYWDRAFRLAWRIVRDPAEAEDAAQQALVKAARGGWRGEAPFSVWLTRIVVNEARNAAAAGRRRARHEVAARGAPPGGRGEGRESDLSAAVDA